MGLLMYGISSDCRLTYYARIEIEPFWNELVKLEIICDGSEQHGMQLSPPKPYRITGEERELLM
jgi:hypothetical protein